MPPVKSGKVVSASQILLLKRWIDEGAEYQGHWSFEPVPQEISLPKDSQLGSGDASLQSWARNEIDLFVAKSLVDHHLRPSQETDRARWLRRVTFDLTGLPPTIEELDAFLNDQSTNAYESVVDRLLARDSYGERMANMWLDVARYADTFGYQADVDMDVCRGATGFQGVQPKSSL